MKFSARILHILLFLSFLGAAILQPAAFAQTASKNDGVFRILASTFPVWLFTKNICAGIPRVKVELLVPAAAGCPHDLALKPSDLGKLEACDVLVVNGAGLETFLNSFLNGQGKRPVIIDAAKGVKTLSENSHGHEHANPHIFASPATAAQMAKNIASGLQAADESNGARYAAAGEKYVQSLESLAEKFRHIGQKAKNRAIALEHDALAYMAQNAGLEIVAIFENNLAAAALMRLEKELMAKKPALLAGDSQYPVRLLQTLSTATGIPFAQLDPCASGPADPPLDYYQLEMEKNLKILEAHFE